MAKITVYDKPMCCSTGVCGPQVDPVLPRFAADLEWLKTQGHQVDRFNLAQQPDAFMENKAVYDLVTSCGTDCLPVIVVDDRITSKCDYPTRENFTSWILSPATAASLPIAKSESSCCGGTKCC